MIVRVEVFSGLKRLGEDEISLSLDNLGMAGTLFLLSL